ncbi:MAG: hypothetical protein IJZ36_02835 [Bacilli bacterium]|nr:hypothetical protein [Bacilli bacterium]
MGLIIMTKQEREKIRIEISKRYKDEITDLRRQNQKFCEIIKDLTEENRRLKMENNRLNNVSDFDKKLSRIMSVYKNMI